MLRHPARRGVPRAIGSTLLIVVCALAFFTVVVPLVLGAQSYTVLTGSMRPALEPGHLIAVRVTPIDEIKPGDIITFQLESGKPEVATHRVVGVGYSSDGERLFVTKGDANNVQDENPVQAVQIRGVLVYAVPWLGYLNVWATPAVKSIVVTVVGIGAIAWGVIVLLKDTRRRRRVAKATTAAAAVVAASAVIALSPVGTPSATAHAADSPPLLLSTDGTTWTGSPELEIADAAHRIVPGEEIPLNLWIQNASDDLADVTVTGAWSPTDPADAGDVALARDLIAPQLDDRTIDPGESIKAPLSVGLAAGSGASTRTSSAALTVNVTLTESTTTVSPSIDDSAAAPDDPLATTGADVPFALILAASVLVGAGIILLIIRAVAAKRQNRRDP